MRGSNQLNKAGRLAEVSVLVYNYYILDFSWVRVWRNIPEKECKFAIRENIRKLKKLYEFKHLWV